MMSFGDSKIVFEKFARRPGTNPRTYSFLVHLPNSAPADMPRRLSHLKCPCK